MRAFWLSALGLCLSLGVAAAQPRGFTADDMVRLARVSDPQLSPSGDAVAFTLRETDMAANKGRTDIFALDLSRPGATPVRLAAHEANESSPRWSADGARIYFLSTRSGSSQVWSVAAAGGGATQVTDYPVDVAGFHLAPKNDRLVLWADVFPDCPDLICTKDRLAAPKTATGRVYDGLFVRHWDTWSNGTRATLFSAPLAGGKAGAPVKLTGGLIGDAPSKPFGGGEEVTISPDGRTVFFTLREAGRIEAISTNLDLFAVPIDGSAPPRNLTDANDATDTQPRVSPDGKTLAYLAMARPGFEADRLVLTLLDLQSGQKRPLTQGFDRSIGAFQWSPDGKSLIAEAQDTGRTLLFRVDAMSGAVTKLTTEGTVAEFAVGQNGRILASRHSLTAPADLYLGEAKPDAAWRRLTAFNDQALASVAMGAPEQFSFKGAGNETVYGWVVKPANFEEGKKYPIAFLVHGGPQGSFGDNWHYRWNAQTYAGAGYAVVMIDFHGSTGYGQAFTDSISGDWGGKPLEDLQKGLAAASERYGWLDKSNACALGGSYGGYMMAWIAGRWPNGFKCLVNHAGIVDTRFMGLSTEELWFTEWENGGTVWGNPAGYENHNPIRHIDRWKTPTLVIHGEQDFRVPYTQGLAIFNALQRKGIESRLLYFPDENHWILKPANSVQWHAEVNGWLDRHLKAPTPAN